jgi:hypothetical protein
MFNNTFYGCTGLTGANPAQLFRGITGVPPYYSTSGFSKTFNGTLGAVLHQTGDNWST